MGSKKTTTTSTTTPYGASKPGIDKAQALATSGLDSATPYSGRFTPETSSYTFGALDSLKSLLPQVQGYGQNALNIPDYLYNKVMSGGYRPATYDPAAAIEAGARPIIEKYSENLLPNLNALMTQSGGYQGQAPGGVSNTAGESLSRNLTREVSQVAGEQSLAAAALNSKNILEALGLENQTLGGLPGMYAQGLTAAQLPSQLQGQIGAGIEGLQGRDIMEALQQNQYSNLWEASIAAPYQDIFMGPAQAFSTNTTTTKQKTDPIAAAIQTILAGAQVAAQAGAFTGLPGAAGGAPTSILPGGAAPSYGYGAPMNPMGASSLNFGNMYTNPYQVY